MILKQPHKVLRLTEATDLLMEFYLQDMRKTIEALAASKAHDTG